MTPDPSKTVQTVEEICLVITKRLFDFSGEVFKPNDPWEDKKERIKNIIKEYIQHERSVAQEEIKKIYQDCADIVATADSKTIAYKLICEKIK